MREEDLFTTFGCTFKGGYLNFFMSIFCAMKPFSQDVWSCVCGLIVVLDDTADWMKSFPVFI